MLRSTRMMKRLTKRGQSVRISAALSRTAPHNFIPTIPFISRPHDRVEQAIRASIRTHKRAVPSGRARRDNMNVGPCSHCGSSDLRTTTANAVGAAGPDWLPEASGWITPAKFQVVGCCKCGLTRFFAPQEELDRIAKSAWWEVAG